jgi:hypothetical protein
MGGEGNNIMVGGSGRDSPCGGPGDHILIDFYAKNRYYKTLIMFGNADATIGSAASWVSEFVSHFATTGDANPNVGTQVILKSDVYT